MEIIPAHWVDGDLWMMCDGDVPEGIEIRLVSLILTINTQNTTPVVKMFNLSKYIRGLRGGS